MPKALRTSSTTSKSLHSVSTGLTLMRTYPFEALWRVTTVKTITVEQNKDSLMEETRMGMDVDPVPPRRATPGARCKLMANWAAGG